MPPSKRERANQAQKARPGSTGTGAKRSPSHSPAKLSSSIDDELGTALALAFSIELMGFGLGSLGDDYSKALITVTQSLIERLTAARDACRALREDGRSVLPAAAANDRNNG